MHQFELFLPTVNKLYLNDVTRYVPYFKGDEYLIESTLRSQGQQQQINSSDHQRPIFQHDASLLQESLLKLSTILSLFIQLKQKIDYYLNLKNSQRPGQKI